MLASLAIATLAVAVEEASRDLAYLGRSLG
jgi:hypothetical protein